MGRWVALGVLLGAPVAAWLFVVGLHLVPRWRLRSVPLVKPAPFLLGHLWFFLSTPIHQAYTSWAERYGGIFLTFFGKNACVVLTDPSLIRQVAVKHFAKFHDRPSIINVPENTTNRRLAAIRSGLLVARGGTWGSLRAALNPLFHTTALHAYQPIMHGSADRLLQRIKDAAGDNDATAVDIHALLGRMTMEVIGQTAFGVDFITGNEEADLLEGRPNLVAAVKVIFSTGGFFPGQGVGILFRVMPSILERSLFLLFFTAVGNLAKRLEYARTTFMSCADLLMRAAKQAALERGETVRMADDQEWRWWRQDSPFVRDNPFKGITPAPNSAIDMLLRATNKETGKGLKPVQVAAQCNTLIAAGYETSAVCLAFTIYCLAMHPEAEERLLAEIDAVGGGKEPGLDDLPRFPYVAAVVNESLRLYPPAHTTNREVTARQGCVLEGREGRQHFLPHGTWVHFNIYGLHRSREHWVDPDAFRPERFLDPDEVAKRHPNAFMPFGLGPRMCIGYRFALQEVQTTLVRLYTQYTFRLAAQQEQPLPVRAGITLAPKGGLLVTARKRARVEAK